MSNQKRKFEEIQIVGDQFGSKITKEQGMIDLQQDSEDEFGLENILQAPKEEFDEICQLNQENFKNKYLMDQIEQYQEKYRTFGKVRKPFFDPIAIREPSLTKKRIHEVQQHAIKLGSHIQNELEQTLRLIEIYNELVKTLGYIDTPGGLLCLQKKHTVLPQQKLEN